MKLIWKVHDQSSIDHFEILRTMKAIRRYYYWLSMRKTINRYIQNCYICQRLKASRDKFNELLHSLLILEQWWKTIEHHLRLNEYILYVFEQTWWSLTIFRAKICLESRSEMSSTFKPQKRWYEVSRSTRADFSQLIESDYLWCLLETFSM